MSTTKDRVTLERLVRLLEKDASPPSDHLTHLKLQATVKHARELLQQARNATNSTDFYPPSTSRSGAPSQGSLADLEMRIDKADQKLQDSWELVSASSRSSTPVERSAGGLDLDFLLPTLPPPMPIPRSSRPQSPSTPASSSPLPTKKPKRDEPVLLNSTFVPSSTSSRSRSPSPPPSNPYELKPHPSELSASTGSGSTLRHRNVPAPWLRNRQLKEQEREKERERERLQAESSTSNGPPSKSSAISDLLPADSPSSVTSSDLLSHHHALQSSLLSDLTSLSSALKTSSQVFSENLEKDKEVMKEAEKQLEGNEGKMKVQQERLKGVRSKTRGTTCWTLGILTVVAFLWIMVFLLIKVT
ncbi:uncharacterized protein JCM6883_005842 [Sporobolomyces salmoneus]|uniref:uncharacterized protein n=1 Tax=Sporobolomyces salmoneus TaxID=183962 RepID=UPI00317910C9